LNLDSLLHGFVSLHLYRQQPERRRRLTWSATGSPALHGLDLRATIRIVPLGFVKQLLADVLITGPLVFLSIESRGSMIDVRLQSHKNAIRGIKPLISRTRPSHTYTQLALRRIHHAKSDCLKSLLQSLFLGHRGSRHARKQITSGLVGRGSENAKR
jgi:hypothetical protein